MCTLGRCWSEKNTIINNEFAFHVTNSIASSEQNDKFDPLSVAEYTHRADWPKWNEAIKVELKLLMKCEMFGPIVQTPKGVKPV